MIVIGADTHKSTHTLAAVDAATGQLLGQRTVRADRDGMLAAWRWAHELGPERVWAIEDCRHVSGRLERCLTGQGERVVRVAPKLMGQARRGERARGKSDEIDATAVARVALREGVDALPCAWLDERAMEIRLLSDHRADLVAERTRLQNRLRWHLVELDDELEASLPVARLDRPIWLDRIARRLARMAQTARVRVARDELRRIRELTRAERELRRELGALVAAHSPALLAERGCGPLTAATLIGRTAGAQRFPTDGHFARHAGAAPIPASSGRRDRVTPQPRRRPPAQLRAAPNRRHQGPQLPRDARLPRSQARRRQDPTRGLPLPQTPPRPPHLDDPHSAQPDQAITNTIDIGETAWKYSLPCRPRGVTSAAGALFVNDALSDGPAIRAPRDLTALNPRASPAMHERAVRRPVPADAFNPQPDTTRGLRGSRSRTRSDLLEAVGRAAASLPLPLQLRTTWPARRPRVITLLSRLLDRAILRVRDDAGLRSLA